jgi:SAM-dependent methyltransferase
MTGVPSSALTIRHEHCPLCTGTAAPYLTDTCDLHYGIEGRWNYERCLSCRVVFLNPAPTALFLDSAYDDGYYSYQEFVSEPAWKRAIRRVIGYQPGSTGDPRFERPGRVLDIGCGSGEFLYKMKLAGWETHGVEVSAKAAALGNSAHGLNIQAGTLASAQLAPEAFDYIRLNHSFEHLLDPRGTLQLIHRYLAPTGRLFIGVPNVEGFAARAFGKYWWNLGPPVHPFNYSRHTLTWLLDQHGFEILSYRTNSNFAGILGSLQMAVNFRRGLRKDTGRVLSNPVGKILAHWGAKLTDLLRSGDCLEITARKRPERGGS